MHAFNPRLGRWKQADVWVAGQPSLQSKSRTASVTHKETKIKANKRTNITHTFPGVCIILLLRKHSFIFKAKA